MKLFLRTLIIAASTLLPQVAFAGEVQWKFVGASSIGNGIQCSKSSTEYSSAGNDLSLLLPQMNISMPAGAKPNIKSQWGTCFILFKVTVPQGETIVTTSSTLIGGILKDKGVQGYIDAVTMLTQQKTWQTNPYVGFVPFAFGSAIHLQRNMNSFEQINEPLFEMTKSQNLSPAAKKQLCKLTLARPAELGLYIRLSVAATRRSTSTSAIIKIDSMDQHFDLSMRSEACPVN